ncbi:MAG: rhodanese-like domain-containing protein [Halioglobus sp.]|nr:rhodanese-like domain-containing protein [Halioglobus sp.]
MLIHRSIAALVALILALGALPALADTVWVDVRSSLEHKIDNIEGDTRISHSDIVPEIEKLYPDRDTSIKLYCRSGGRAGKAEEALRAAGYTDVENVGGIGDARKRRSLAE